MESPVAVGTAHIYVGSSFWSEVEHRSCRSFAAAAVASETFAGVEVELGQLQAGLAFGRWSCC